MGPSNTFTIQHFKGEVEYIIKNTACPKKLQLRKHAILTAPRKTSKFALLLGNPKYAIDDHNKYSIYIYKICCQTCPALNIGQTKRNIEQRIKEHFSHMYYQISSQGLHHGSENLNQKFHRFFQLMVQNSEHQNPLN
jgi:hypothetical protein